MKENDGRTREPFAECSVLFLDGTEWRPTLTTGFLLLLKIIEGESFLTVNCVAVAIIIKLLLCVHFLEKQPTKL